MSSFAPKGALQSAAVFVLCLLAARAGMPAPFTDPGSPVLWPPSAVALAALVAFGPKVFAAVLLGALAGSVWGGLEPLAAAGISTSLAVAALLGGWLVRRFARGVRAFEQPRTTSTYVLIAIAVSAPFAAAAGVAVLISVGHLAASDADRVWLAWWWSDIVAMVGVAPALMLWARQPGLSFARRRGDRRAAGHGRPFALEAAALAVAAILAGLLMFASWARITPNEAALAVLPFPLVIWAAFRFGPRETATVVALFAGMAAWGVVRGQGPVEESAASLRWLQLFLATTGTTALLTAAAIDQRNRADSELQQLAVTDPLTGLANQRRLREAVDREIGRSQRSLHPFALLLLDVDNLKITNDRLGHGVGSRLLVRLADALRKSCRVTDLISRYGGDEFSVLLPGCDLEAARTQVARVLAAIADDVEEPPISVSIGVAVHPGDGHSCDELIDKADAELYAIKRSRKSGGKADRG